jgi:hypothetical protein
MDRRGATIGTVGAPGVYFNMDLSPDERRLAISQYKEQANRPGSPFDVDIQLLDLAHDGAAMPLTDHPEREFNPAWSRDGMWIAFISTRDGGAFYSFRRRSSGAGDDEPLGRPAGGSVATVDWSLGDRHLMYTTRGKNTQKDLWTLSVSDRQESVFLETKYNETSGVFSPDDRWIGYVSDESGTNQVYVRPFPRGEGRWRISHGGGWAPQWRADSRELYFLAPDGGLMAAGIKVVNGAVEGDVPQRLFRTGLGPTKHDLPYAVAARGQRFLIPVPVDPPEAAPINIVLDWPQHLLRHRPGQ